MGAYSDLKRLYKTYVRPLRPDLLAPGTPHTLVPTDAVKCMS